MSQLEKIFQTMGNKTRLEIVFLILSKGEVSCQVLLKKFPLSQPTMSHHFKELLNSNILKVRKLGVENYYSIDKNLLSEVGIDAKKVSKLALREFQTVTRGGEIK